MSAPLKRFMNREQRLILDSLLLGVVGALAAQGFMWALRGSELLFLNRLAGYRPPELPGEGGVLRQFVGPYGLWLIPLSTTLGGLVSGLLVYGLAPEAEGHGTDTTVRAYHRAAGFIRARVPFLKLVASAVTIGSGGAAGREGPTALIASGVGSIYASIGKRSDDDRRLLALIGMAAGLSAIFRSPIGTAIFATEVLYGTMEFEGGALIYAMLAAVVAYVINGLFVGWQPLFRVPGALETPGFTDYGSYVVLGLAAGLVATVLPVVFYGVRDAFRRLPGPPHLKPAIGGLGIGLLALAVPQILGGGYGWIQEAIDGKLALGLLAALLAAKILALSLTVSSGGSGGIFAPSLFVGAMLGGLLGRLLDQPTAAFVVVGMAAVFGGAARVPVATLLMVSEMTGGYTLLVPAALAVMLSYVVQGGAARRFRYRSLYEAQVPRRADSPAHHVEHLRIALELLDAHKVPEAPSLGRIDLLALLESGIPVDLADGRQLSLGTLRQDSSCTGKAIREDCLRDVPDAPAIVAILRERRLILPRPDTVLRGGDRLVLIASPEARQALRAHLQPVVRDPERDG